MRDRRLQLLRSVPLLWGCSDKELRSIVRLVEEVDLPDGKEVMREGDTGAEMFVIVQGKARVSRNGRKIATLGPGDVAGEMALLDGGPRTATVTTEGPMKVLVIGRRDFTTFLRDAPHVSLKLLRTLAERIRAGEPRSPH